MISCYQRVVTVNMNKCTDMFKLVTFKLKEPSLSLRWHTTLLINKVERSY